MRKQQLNCDPYWFVTEQPTKHCLFVLGNPIVKSPFQVYYPQYIRLKCCYRSAHRSRYTK